MRSSNLVLIRAFCVSALFGCVATKGYTGEAPSDQSVATVRGDGVTFNSVNGISVGSFSKNVEVLPGKNSLVLTVDASNYISRPPTDPTFTLEFQAESGANYVVTGQRGDGRLCAWKVNPESGDPDFRASAGCIVR